MTALYDLPTKAVLGDKVYSFRADFREVLRIIACLEDAAFPEYVRWLTALALFYEDPVPAEHRQAAMQYLAFFLAGGQPDQKPGPKLLDWEQDAAAILAGVNKASGQEVRALAYLHWWSFLGWFHAIDGGPLANLVSIRDKLARGKKLEDWERDFYRQNKACVDLKKRYTPEELAEQNRLKALISN